MSASVPVSLRSALLLSAFREHASGSIELRAFDELDRSIASARNRSAKRAPRLKEKKAKRLAKNDETAAIRKEVFRRASGACEECNQPFTDFDPGEMDHFWGRANAPQTVKNCWALCRICHRLKTADDPSPEHWFEAFTVHAGRHNYVRECNKAWAAYEAAKAKRAADLVTTAKHATIDLGEIKRAALSGKEGA